MADASSTLKRVSKLTIRFLVDNNLEWMTKLPPGFTHELHQHIPHSRHATADKGSVPVFDLNDFCCGAHGFAALIETEVDEPDEARSGDGGEQSDNPRTKRLYRTLFDTGPDSLSLVRNIKALQIPITTIDRVVTSHWHSDHTGGLLSFLELRKKCIEDGIDTPPLTSSTLPPLPGTVEAPQAPSSSEVDQADSSGSRDQVKPCIVDVHPSRPHLRGIAPPPKNNHVICALPPDPTFEAIEEAGGVLEKRRDGHTVAGGTVWISGEVPRVTEWEAGLLGGVRWVEEGEEGYEREDGEEEIGPVGDNAKGRWKSEPHLMDERYAAVDVEGKGLVLFSSCSHAGIVNVAKDAVNTFKRPIYMIVGGLHLASADLYPRIEPTVSFFSDSLRPSPTYILPMHCTGWKAKVALEAALGEGVVPAGVGHKVEVEGVAEESGAGRAMWVEIIDP
ncbi:hypothetical protein NMY22_g11328 [Coprinellus aureogranulatus]|nr:hypothetical protein NMY22_g11328 [Coprinellus aureogranulatus]